MFLAHVNDLKPGEWQVYPQLPDWTLCRLNNGEYQLASNRCPHMGARFKGCQGSNTRVCPYHGWTFNVDGTPKASGLTKGCANTHPLDTRPVFIWNGFIFTDEHDLPPIELESDVVLESFRVDTVDASSENIMNLFLDVEHIRLVHGRVYAHLDSDAITWIYGDNSSIQLVNDVEGQPASQWFAVYRDEAMLEWQPGAWFITQPHAQKGQVSVYRYKSRTSTPEQWQTNCTTWETSWGQDNELVSQLADKFSSVYPLDPARQHYQDWLKNQTDK